MPSLIKPQPPTIEPTLLESTSRSAGRTAARYAGARYRRILECLDSNGPQCIFEVAEKLGCLDHQISGRFGELVKADQIRRTGHRKQKPSTGCQADLYEITLIGRAALAGGEGEK